MTAPAVGKNGRWSEQSTFKLRKLQEVAAADKFDDSQGKTTLPTWMLDDEVDPSNLQEGVITRIHFRLNPANAVTYTLRLWRKAVNGGATPYTENLEMLFETVAGLADDSDYDYTELNIPFRLYESGKMYYSIEWSAASGNVAGFIEVSGETMK